MGDPEALLAAEEREVRRRLAALVGDFDEVVAASRDTNADDEHDPEGATIGFERAQIDALVRRTQEHLAEVEAAQGRLRHGSYGSCEGCGRPIAPERLEARPAARRCVACAT